MRVRAPWLTATDESPLAGLLLLPLLPLSWLYGLGARLHRGVYRLGLRRRSRLPERVVSVGSLAVGGSGKTPLAAWIARGLRRRGYKVALASRGVGGRADDAVTVVSDGSRVRDRVEGHVGDEALVLAARAPGVPVLVGRNRALVGWRALSAFGTEVLVLDDGFQHHALARDVDLVCLDGGLSLGNRRLLPRGPLREPVGAVRDAHAVVVIDGPLAPADGALLRRVGPGAHFEAARLPARLRPLRGGEATAPAALRGAPVGMLAALANPREFRRTLEALGARVVAERVFPDHHRYRARDLRGLADAAPLWVTTEKDAFKILPPWVGPADVRVLAIDVDVRDGGAFLDWIEARLR